MAWESFMYLTCFYRRISVFLVCLHFFYFRLLRWVHCIANPLFFRTNCNAMCSFLLIYLSRQFWTKCKQNDVIKNPSIFRTNIKFRAWHILTFLFLEWKAIYYNYHKVLDSIFFSYKPALPIKQQTRGSFLTWFRV